MTSHPSSLAGKESEQKFHCCPRRSSNYMQGPSARLPKWKSWLNQDYVPLIRYLAPLCLKFLTSRVRIPTVNVSSVVGMIESKFTDIHITESKKGKLREADTPPLKIHTLLVLMSHWPECSHQDTFCSQGDVIFIKIWRILFLRERENKY